MSLSTEIYFIDAMFVKMGKFLRILGLNTLIATPTLQDSVIAEEVIANKYALVTADKELRKHVDNYLKVIFIQENELEDQLVEFFSQTGIDLNKIDVEDPIAYSSRCTTCNAILTVVENKEDLVDSIPEQSYIHFTEFWICSNDECKQIFWKGSHWENITYIFNQVKKRLA